MPGHEVSGVVVELGYGTTGLSGCLSLPLSFANVSAPTATGRLVVSRATTLRVGWAGSRCGGRAEVTRHA